MVIDTKIHHGRITLYDLPLKDDTLVKVIIIPKTNLQHLSFQQTRILLQARVGRESNAIPTAVVPAPRNVKSMNHVGTEVERDMLDEYDFSGGVRGKYAARYREGTNIVRLDDDVAAVFQNAEEINELW